MQAQTRSEGVSNLSSDPPLSGGHTSGSGEGRMEHTFELKDIIPPTHHDSPLPRVNTPGSDKGRLKLEELMVMCTKLSKQVLDLEKEKDAQVVEIFKLKKRVKKLERQRNPSISHPRRRIYDDFDDLDDLVDEGMAFVLEKDADNQGKIGANDTEVVKGSGDTKAVNIAAEGVSTASVSETVSTAAPRTPPTTTIVLNDEDVTMAMAQTLIKMKEEKDKEERVAIKDVEDSSRPVRSITTLQPLPTIDPKDKAEMFDEVQERMDADYELAARMTQEEQEKYTIEERASQLKEKSYEEVQGLYERQQKRIQDFTLMDLEKEAQKPGKRLKRVAGSYATQKLPKKPKVMKSAKDVTEEETTEYWFQDHPLKGHDLLLWGDLRLIFIPNEKDEVWMNQLDWKLYEICGVHTLFMDGTSMEINMLVEKKCPLVKELLKKMLNLQLEAEEESTMAFALIKFIKSLLEE
ncbi:hypothetical protein Tco_1277636 [Tanacetum coccineum]